DFYRQYNGGTPEHAEVTDKKHIFSVHEFYDLSDIQFFKDDLDEYSVPPVLDHTKTLPFACDQGGNTFALYLERENAKVYFYTTSDEMTIHGEWQSFSDFIDSFIK
ncbi:MAG: SMI1/KNR4 family protein, partial [Reinekea sp.]